MDIPMGIGMACGPALIIGEKGAVTIDDNDSYYEFKKQMDKFVHYIRTGEEPFPFEHTVEMMRIIIAGIRSREEGGRKVMLSEISAR